MAISLGFGIIFATSIILVIVPCLYMILEDLASPGVLHIEDQPEKSLSSGDQRGCPLSLKFHGVDYESCRKEGNTWVVADLESGAERVIPCPEVTLERRTPSGESHLEQVNPSPFQTDDPRTYPSYPKGKHSQPDGRVILTAGVDVTEERFGILLDPCYDFDTIRIRDGRFMAARATDCFRPDGDRERFKQRGFPSMRFHVGDIRRTCFTLCIAILLPILPFPAAAEAASKNILVLHSYHRGLSWTDSIMDGMVSAFDESGLDPEIHVEYMDTKRHPPEDSFRFLETFYREKYQKTSFDVILLSDNNALRFLLFRRNRLFPGVPVVFCGINNFDGAMLRGRDGITGVIEEVNIGGTIGLAKRLLPHLQRLVVINDRTPTGMENLEKFHAETEEHRYPDLLFEVWDDLTAEALKQRLTELPEDTAILLFTFHRDKTGRWLSIPEYLKLIRDSTTVPVFSFWDNYLDHGILGGVMVHGREQGRRCAQYGIEILRGTPVSALPVPPESPNVPLLDHRMLKKFGIPKDRIPEEAVVLFAPESILRRHRNAIAASAAAFLALFVLVVFLTANILLRRRAARKLAESEERYRRLAENSPDVIYRLAIPSGVYEYVSPASETIFGYSPEECYANPLLVREVIHPDWSSYFEEQWARLLRGDLPPTYEYQVVRKDGEVRWINQRNVPVRDAEGRLIAKEGIVTDITERKALEAQLLQARKIESVGRLAGGVAHDFNNMLTIILGNIDMSIGALGEGDPLVDRLEEARKAAQRSTDLVRRLLAFARRQTTAPRVIDLNCVLEEMLRMLKRLIGEEIELAWSPQPALWPVRIDPSQVDQILANLCVNARDSIDGIGRVAIETRNVHGGGDQSPGPIGMDPGDYVLLSVADTGCGMDPETLDHLFEPFYTTKEVGKGTGLGLATVYGIVKQNNGFIYVASEPGAGTTFNIYLPRHAAEEKIADPGQKREKDVLEGSETILLVDDEEPILQMARRLLKSLGYTVLAASSPAEAVRMGESHRGEIDLLITDVVMPGMNGRDLAEKIKAMYPKLRCLYMSGYTDDAIARYGVLETGVHFIHKPFSKQELALKARMVLA